MSTEPLEAGPDRIRNWTRITLGCTMVALSLTLVRVAQLKVAPPDKLDAAAGRRTSERAELAPRGEVLDRRGRPLAMSLVGYRLYCDPAFIYERGWDAAKKRAKTDPNAVAECDPFRDAAIALAPILRTTPQQVHELLKTNAERRYVVLAQDVDEAQVDLLRQLDLDGIGMETKLVRDYPAGGLASQLVGKVGFEHTGQAGVEYAFDRDLRPVPGHVKALRDAFGRTLWINRQDYVPGDPGDDVRLSIDLAIQESAERHLGKMVDDMNAGGGRVIVLDAQNGDVLAMADILRERPGWKEATRDPSRKIHPALGRNRNFTDPYEPGSTFKTFVYLTALEAGWEPDDTIPNTPILQGSYRPKNARDQYSEQITLEDAFAQSSNVAAVRLLQAVGSEKVIRNARSLGITAPMAEGDPSLALGTSALTLMELTAAYAGIAANDFPVEPHAFARGEPGWWEWLTTRKDSMSRGTHESLEDMLRAAINRGTGRNAVLPIANFGKTGTTQDYRDALFVGYAGDLVVGVWIGNDDNSPLNGVTGGSTPARIWRDFMRGALKLEAAPKPKTDASPDPEGPVQPLDMIEGGEIPLGQDGATLKIDGGGVTLTQEGVPVEVRVDQRGVAVQPAPSPSATPP